MHVKEAARDIRKRREQPTRFAPQPKLLRGRLEPIRSSGQDVERGSKIGELMVHPVDERHQHAPFLTELVLDLVPCPSEIETMPVRLGQSLGKEIALFQVDSEI